MKYSTIQGFASSEFIEKKSKFIGLAYPVDSIDQIKEIIDEVRASHPKARHWCYAYKCISNEFRMNDDGEPSGTAGKPIYNQIESFNLNNVLLIVVRYFGGIKLGTGGLIKAYKTVARSTLANTQILNTESNLYCTISGPSEIIQICFSHLKSMAIKILHFELQGNASISFGLPESALENVFLRLKSKVFQIPQNDISDPFHFPNCSIKTL